MNWCRRVCMFTYRTELYRRQQYVRNCKKCYWAMQEWDAQMQHKRLAWIYRICSGKRNCNLCTAWLARFYLFDHLYGLALPIQLDWIGNNFYFFDIISSRIMLISNLPWYQYISPGWHMFYYRHLWRTIRQRNGYLQIARR